MHDPATVGKQNPKLIALVPGTSCNLRNWRPKRFYFKTRGGRTASTASANVKGRDYYVVIRPSAGQWPARIPPPHSAGPASHVRLFSAAFISLAIPALNMDRPIVLFAPQRAASLCLGLHGADCFSASRRRP